MLRLITAGSVDDGKSTLIGRLLYDSKSIFIDQLDSILDKESGEVNLAHITDGLKSEREQGITIDVAYKYFSTRKRKFIIADAPGHVQYTRNMVTGASNSDLIIVLIDATKGVIEQTRRHTLIASLLRIPRLCLAINKMDLVGYSEKVFENIFSEFTSFSKTLNFESINVVPVCALEGDNVVEKSINMPWYKGKSLLEILETISSNELTNNKILRLPVQLVLRDNKDYRAYSGRLCSGVLKVGDNITVYPSGLSSIITQIDLLGNKIDEAISGMSIAIRLRDELDISRGDIICGSENSPKIGTIFKANICWMDYTPLIEGSRFLLHQGTNSTRIKVQNLINKINISNGLIEPSQSSFLLNEIGLVEIVSARPMVWDDYSDNRQMGSFILINENSNQTVAAGMIC
jgi:sulfate adenylyltransferase subunit 1